MKHSKLSILLSLLFLSNATTSFCQNDLSFINIGDFKTVEGETIKNCKLGYRTFGTLNEDKSNVVLWTTWFTGTSADLVNYNILNSTMDTSGLYIIAVDALTNGVSSSPSNSENFPAVTIRDMVNSQHLLLTKHLSINHIKAVMGYSMGGIQALEWSIAYPQFMDKVVSIAGTPKLSFYDLLLWNTQIKLIENAKNDPQKLSFAMERVMDLTTMNLYTPAYYASSQNADNMESYMENIYKQQKMKPEDYLAGLRAIVRQNLFVAQDGSVNDLNKIIKAKILLIAAEQDHMANPIGSITLSKELDAPLLVLESNCGHIAVFCEAKKIRKVVMDFL
jgi:homoserine O-acetyltransferase